MISLLRLLKLNFSSKHIRRVLFALVVIGLIAVSVLSYWTISQLIEDRDRVELSYKVIIKLTSISAIVSAIAADVRKDTVAGIPWSTAAQTIETQLKTEVQELDDLIPDSSSQEARVITLRQALNEHFMTLQAAAEQNVDDPSNLDTVLLGQQQQISGATEKFIGEMSTEEQSVLLERQGASTATGQKTFVIGSSVAVSSVLLLILIFVSLDRETTKHQRTAWALRDSEERSRSIITVLTEGVLLIEANGAVAIMNPSAESILTPVAKDGLNRVQLYQEDGTALAEENYPSVLALRTGKAQHDVILSLEHVDHEQIWIATNTQPLFHNGADIPYATVTSLSDITERLRFERALEEARDQALDASRAKAAFLATMSHEIRTPMNGVIGMTELMLDMPISDAQREMVEVIRTSGSNLLTIINDILDFSKIEAGKLTLENAEFQPLSLLESAADVIKAQVYQKKLSLTIFVDPAIPHSLCGDALRLRQILINLIGNAVKFTEQGEIVVRATLETLTKTQATVRFSVSDTGIGLSETARQRLFQPFMQADDSMSRRYGGTGLGLAICASLVELMHGQIGVESCAGTGSDFWFSIALNLLPTTTDSYGPVVSPMDVDNLRVPVNLSAPDLSPFAAQEPQVLLVEDNAINQKVATMQLQKLGLRVEIASNGQEALDAIAENSYSLVFMDCQMPGIDGFEAARRVRQLEAGSARHIPIIAMTANAMQGDKEACLLAGMDDYIAKPMNLPQIQVMLEKWLPTSHMTK